VHDRVDAGEVVDGEVADVLVEGERGRVDAVVEPALLVEAGVDADDLVAVADELRGEQAAEVTLGACDKNLHGGVPS
jgi:hypothetical protein